MRIVFLVGSADISGGSFVIFQHALYLKHVGHDVVVASQMPFSQEQLDWHPEARQLRWIDFDETDAEPIFDVVVATWWRTALDAWKVRGRHYIYDSPHFFS